jgi:hypothetical protein
LAWRRRSHDLKSRLVGLSVGPDFGLGGARLRHGTGLDEVGVRSYRADLVGGALRGRDERRRGQTLLLGEASDLGDSRSTGAVVLDGDVLLRPARVAPTLKDHSLAILAAVNFLADDRHRALGAPSPDRQVLQLLAVAALVAAHDLDRLWQALARDPATVAGLLAALPSESEDVNVKALVEALERPPRPTRTPRTSARWRSAPSRSS